MKAWLSNEENLPTVVELISRMLKREGVQYLFGVPGGGGTIDLLDATEKDGIRFILNSHETASAIMACVVAELTGVPGVVLTAISPGVANIANGVAYAYLERVPLLVCRIAIHETQARSCSGKR